ncbi:exodeoxyribonuclease VII large subunit, partial [bacterium]|nr:exodeoxyribonuclease VII large subunit [bacterium]
LELLRRLQAAAVRLARVGKKTLAGRRETLAGLARGLVDPRRRLADKRLRVDDLRYRAGHAARAALARDDSRLAKLKERLAARRPGRVLAQAMARAERLAYRLEAAGPLAVAERRRAVEGARGRLRALSPLAVLGRGYALVSDAAGALLKSAEEARIGDLVKVRLARGGLTARVEEKDS